MKSCLATAPAMLALACVLSAVAGVRACADAVAAPAFDGAALLARYRSLPACRLRVREEVTDGDSTQRASGTLVFRRPGWLRVDWEGFGQPLRLVKTPRDHRVYFPQEQTFTNLASRQPQSLVWDGFASPVRSLAALLDPGPRDTAVIARSWLPWLKAAPPETADGTPWLRFEGVGAFESHLQLWVSPADHLIRRVTLQQPRDPDSRADIHIEVELPEKPFPESLFRLDVPALARDTDAPEPNAPLMQPVDPGSPVPSLRRRVADRPGDQGALRALIEALLQTGGHPEALRLALRLSRQDPSPAGYETLAHTYLQIGAPRAALNVYLKAVKRHGVLARIPNDPGGADDAIVSAAHDAGKSGELVAALEAVVAVHLDAFSQRALLAGVYVRERDTARAAKHVAGILAPAGTQRTWTPEQLEAAGRVLPLIADLAPSLDAAARKSLAAAFRGIEAKLPSEVVYSLIPVYIALDDLPAAQQLCSQAMQAMEWAAPMLLGGLAEGLAAHGDAANADRLFREALAMVVENDGFQNPTIVQLVQLPHARAVLTPVFRRLSEAERSSEPLQSAHWLFFAGDAGEAASAYRSYLAGSTSGADRAPAMDRITAAAMGARCARLAKKPELARELVLGAVPDLVRLRMSMPQGYALQPHLNALLGGLDGPDARRAVLERLASLAPDLLIESLQYAGPGAMGGGGQPPVEVKSLLRQVVNSPAADLCDPMTLVQALQTHGLVRDAASLYLRLARQFPAQVDPNLAVSLAGAADSTDPPGNAPAGAIVAPAAGASPPSGDHDLAKALIQAAETAVRLHPGRDAAESALAEWYLSHQQAPRALTILSAIATRRHTAEAFEALAQAELAAGRKRDGLDHMQRAARLAKDAWMLRPRYLMALQAAGKRSEALRGWQDLKPKATTPEQVSQVVNALRGLDREKEAIDYIEARLPALRRSERYPGEADDLRSQLADRYLLKGQLARVAALYPEIALFDDEIDPEALAQIHLSLPAPLWKYVVSRLDRAGRTEVAFAVYAHVLAEGGLDEGEESYQGLIDRAHRLGRLDAARDALRLLTSQNPTNEHARAWLASVEAERGDEKAADALYRRILHRDGASYPHATPGAARAARGLAVLLEKQGKGPEAAQCRSWAESLDLLAQAEKTTDDGKVAEALRRAQSLFPESPCVQAALVVRQMQSLGEKPSAETKAAAESALTRALELMMPTCGGVRDCPHCGALLQQAASWHSSSRPSPLERLLAAHPRSAGACFLVAAARTAGRGGEGPADAALWRQVVELDPTLVAAWEALREVSGWRNDLALRIEASEKIATLRADSGQDWFELATVYVMANRREDARQAMRKARDLDPRFDGAAAGFEGRWSQGPWPFMLANAAYDPELAMLFNTNDVFTLAIDPDPW